MIRTVIPAMTIDPLQSDPEKITIVEGPPPAFEISNESWLPGMAEGAHLPHLACCRLRTFRGPAMLERCQHAWDEARSVMLDYRDVDGLRQQALVLAARAVETADGDVLVLWVRLNADQARVQADYGDDDVEDIGDDTDFPPQMPG